MKRAKEVLGCVFHMQVASYSKTTKNAIRIASNCRAIHQPSNALLPNQLSAKLFGVQYN